MNDRIEWIQAWIKSRSERERIFILLGGLAVVYLVWGMILDRPLQSSIRSIDKQIQLLRTDYDTAHQQLTIFSKEINKSSYRQNLVEQSSLSSQKQNLNERLKNILNTTVEKETLPEITNQILKLQQGITLISLKSLTDEPWLSEKLDNLSLPQNIKNIYKHSMQIEFRGNFFNTLNYLNRLENLSWRLYWDSLEYKVLEYPEANVTVTFYVLSNGKN